MTTFEQHMDAKNNWPGPIHLFALRHADANAEGLAIVCPEGSITWSEQRRRATRLATQLRHLSIAPGDVVSIVATRSADLPVAVLACFLCGAVVSLIDCHYPEERTAQLLALSKPACLLLTGKATVTPDIAANVLNVVRASEAWEVPDFDDVLCIETPGPDTPACLTFTSGSTGIPRPVLGRHAGLTAFLPWQCEQFRIGPSDRISMLSGLAHDPIQRDIFTSWFSGATLEIPPENIYDSGGAALRWLVDQRVSMTNLTPSLAKVIGASSSSVQSKHLKLIFLVGEALRARDVELIKQWAPEATLVNLYGSTETQRALLHYVLPDSEVSDPIPLGYAPPGMDAYCVDDSGTRLADGELGEIVIESPYIALGYQDEQHSQGGFGISSTGVARYRTGDIGQSIDGLLYFRGRADRRVKIRGYRVELGEVEQIALRVPSVKRAHAKWFEAKGHLILYVEYGAHTGKTELLKEHFSNSAPRYMVPSRIIEMEALPITANGKVDTNSLTYPSLRGSVGRQTA